MKWRLQTYVDDAGNRMLASWYAGLSDAVKARFQTRVWYLLHQERDNWTRPQFDTLSHDASGFGEIRLGKVEGIETRIVGYFDDDSFYAVLVISKKGSKYQPSNWIKLIHQRRIEIESNKWRANEWIPQAPLGEPEE
jgi:hypothetical protein